MNKEELEKVEQLIEQKNSEDCSPAYILPTLPNCAMNWMPKKPGLFICYWIMKQLPMSSLKWTRTHVRIS